VNLIEEDGDALIQVQEACRKYLSLHHGELESLACRPKLDPECRFCTGDSAAIKALALLGMPERAESLERVLSDNGVPGSGKIDGHFRDDYLQIWLRKGLAIRAQNVEMN
jgi:hypothetical protein